MAGGKKWETRSWKPSNEMQYCLRNGRLLIHASAKFDNQNRRLLTFPPFCGFLNYADDLPTGTILGSVSIGRIIPTTQWVEEFRPDLFRDAATEMAFGNYNSERWAWELLDVRVFETPIPAKGALSIWDFKGSLPEEKILHP